MLTISIVGLTIQETLAVPLKPVLDQVGRRMVERSLGIDSTQAASSDSLAEEDIQQTDPTLAPTEETAPTPVNSAYPQPTYPPAYPSPSIPAYPQQTYPQQTYPPAYPSPSIPAYPQQEFFCIGLRQVTEQ